MKKTIALLTVIVLLIGCVPLSASAAEPVCSLAINLPEYVVAGQTFDVVFNIADITPAVGIDGVEICLSYDLAAFTFVSLESVSSPNSRWVVENLTKETSPAYAHFVFWDETAGDAIEGGGTVPYSPAFPGETISFKATFTASSAITAGNFTFSLYTNKTTSPYVYSEAIIHDATLTGEEITTAAVTIAATVAEISFSPTSSFTVASTTDNISYVSSLPGETIENIMANCNNSSAITFTKANGTVVTSGRCGTGYKMLLKDTNGVVYDEISIVVKGDLSGDARLNKNDYLALKNHLSGQLSITDPLFLLAANVNGGRLNNNDYIALKNYVINGGGTFA